MGDVDIQIDGLEPPRSEESYLPEESRNSSATESFCVNAPFLIIVPLGGHYRRKRGGRQATTILTEATEQQLPAGSLDEANKRLLSSRAQPPSPASFIYQPTHPQPSQGTEHGRPR